MLQNRHKSMQTERGRSIGFAVAAKTPILDISNVFVAELFQV
jgi:hypothetical protein